MKKVYSSSLSLESLLNYFYNDHETLLIYNEKEEIIGAISYNSFINSNSISEMIRNIYIINDETEIEIGDLVSVYCIKDKDSYKEVSKAIDPRYSYTINRFKDLYNDNDIIVNYIKSLDINNIFVIGKYKEYLYNYLDIYGLDKNIYCVEDNDISKLFDEKTNNSLIIDTTGFNIELYNKIINIKKLNLRVLDLKELSKYAEIYNFVNNTSKSNTIESIVFSFPSTEELNNLTEEEKQRIIFDHYYKYYFDAYLKKDKYGNLLKKIFKEYFSKDFIRSRYTMPKVYNRAGVLFLEDSNNSYCRSYNGKRHTTNQNDNYPANINIFGACVVFGALVDDYNTIPSILQRLINTNNYPYQVNNYGARAIDFSENLRTSRNIILHKNDINIYVIMDEDRKILDDMHYQEIISLTPVFNNPKLKNYFVDEPAHCNHIANIFITNLIFKNIKQKLKYNLNKDNCPIESDTIKKDIFKNNKYLIDYLKSLEQLKDFNGKTGSIVMNCNPFTLGHYNLVKYASNNVDRLIVFVVQEDKSYFSFDERYDMAKEACKEFQNVILVPSGNLLASSLTFPEYFEKEENQDVKVDASKDIEAFCKYIAPYLGITKRFVGEENFDKVTHTYNNSLKEILPLYGIELIEIPRYVDKEGQEISAKLVRKNYENDNWNELKNQIPKSTQKILKLIKDRRKIK